MASSPKPPKPVDPNVAAQAQAQWNRFGQRGPGGSVTWEGEGPNQTQVTQWDPRTEALFGQLQGIAGQERQQYAAPEGFSQFRDGLMSRMNDRQQMGRPVYQPTQTFGGTLGPASQAGMGGAAGGLNTMPPPQEISTTPAPGPEGGMGAPQIQANYGMNQNKPVLNADGYTQGMKPPYGMGPPSGMPDIGGQTQPVPPDGKALGMGTGGGMAGGSAQGGLSTLGSLLGGRQTGTPWKDAFMGPADDQGQRHPIRNALQGGLVGSLGRGIGNSLANRGAIADQNRQLGATFERTQGAPGAYSTPNYGGMQTGQGPVGPGSGNPNIDRILAAVGGAATKPTANNPFGGAQAEGQAGYKPKPGKPGKPRGLFKPAGSTSRGRAMSALGMGNQIWGAAQDSRALEDMNIHGRFVPEEQ